MYGNFILKESISVEKFIMNHFDYCSTNKYVDEEELAKFVIRNIKMVYQSIIWMIDYL